MTLNTVGSFAYDDEKNTIVGPADYLAERFDARIAQIKAGRDPVFEVGLRQPGADTVTLTLVSLQTDYAAWSGSRDFLARLNRSGQDRANPEPAN